MEWYKLDDYCVIKANNNQFASQKAISKIIDQYLVIINMDEDEQYLITLDLDITNMGKNEESLIRQERFTDAIYKLSLIIKFYYYSWVFTFRDLLSYCEIFKSLELSLWDWIQTENNKNISEESEDAYLNWE